MAVQLAVAYSSIIKGVGVVAAGPYYCSQNKLLIAMSRCSCAIQPASACQVSTDSADVPKLVSMARTLSADHMIDDVAGITSQRIVTISGAKDGTVPSRVVALAMFADQQGVQMRAIRNMIEQLTSGARH